MATGSGYDASLASTDDLTEALLNGYFMRQAVPRYDSIYAGHADILREESLYASAMTRPVDHQLTWSTDQLTLWAYKNGYERGVTQYLALGTLVKADHREVKLYGESVSIGYEETGDSGGIVLAQTVLTVQAGQWYQLGYTVDAKSSADNDVRFQVRVEMNDDNPITVDSIVYTGTKRKTVTASVMMQATETYGCFDESDTAQWRLTLVGYTNTGTSGSCTVYPMHTKMLISSAGIEALPPEFYKQVT